MLISRRSTLASAAATAALATAPAGAHVLKLSGSTGAQRVQTLLIHKDETGEAPHAVALSFPPAQGWIVAGLIDETAYRDADAEYRAQGYALRRVNAFPTRQGTRFAAVWQAGHTAPAHAAHAMTRGAFEAAVADGARRGLMLAHLDAMAADGDVRFAAIWDSANGAEQTVATDLSAAGFKARAVELAAKGYRVKQIAGTAPNGRARFAALFVKDGGKAQAHHAIPAAQFATKDREMRLNGFNLADASGYLAAGRPFYTAVWEKA